MAKEKVLIDVQLELKNSKKGLDDLNKKLKETKKGSQAFDDLTKEAKELDAEMRKLSVDALKLGGSFEDVYGEVRPLTTQLGELEDVLYQMALAGQQNTQEFKEIQAEAVKMRKTIIQVDEAVDGLAERGANLRGLIGIASGIAGGFAVVQGSMNALGIESEEYEEQMQSMMAVLEILNGLEAVNTALKEKNVVITKAQAFWTKISSKNSAQNVISKSAETTAQGVNTVATNTATVSTTALNSAMLLNPAFWVVAGIMALVGALAFLVLSDSEAEKQEKALAEQISRTGEEYEKNKKRINELNQAQRDRSASITRAMELEGASVDTLRERKTQAFDKEVKEAEQSRIQAQSVYNSTFGFTEKQIRDNNRKYSRLRSLRAEDLSEEQKKILEGYKLAESETNATVTAYQVAVNNRAEYNNQIIEEDRNALQREEDLRLESNLRLAGTEEAKRQVKLNYLIQETEDSRINFGNQSIEYRGALELQKQYFTDFQAWKVDNKNKEAEAQIDFQKELNLINAKGIDEVYNLEEMALIEKQMLYKKGSKEFESIQKQLLKLEVKYNYDSKKLAFETAEKKIEYDKRVANLSAVTNEDRAENERVAFEESLMLYKDDIEKRKAIQLEFDEWKKAQEEIKKEAELEEQQALKEFALDLAQQSSDAIFEQANSNAQRRRDAQTSILTKQSEEEIAIIDNKLEKGLLSEEEASEQKEKVAIKTAKEQEAIEEELFNKNKVRDIAQAVINGALAVTNVMAQTGVASPFIIPSIIATTGLQIATISAQKFEDGGILKGNSHANGGIDMGNNQEAEGGEAVINKKSTAMFRDELSIINQAGGGVKFEQGGVLGENPSTSSEQGLGGLSSRLDALIELSSMPMRAVVSETEITDSQNRINNIEERASF